MSTRAMFTFSDEFGSHHVYKHGDGYPTGAAEALINALPYAWQLPRFEADEFAAAFVAANKSYWINQELGFLRELEQLGRNAAFGASKSTPHHVRALMERLDRCREYVQHNGGGIRLMASGEWKDVAPQDLEYRYTIGQTKAGTVLVTCYRVSHVGETTYRWNAKLQAFKAVKVPKAKQGWQETKLFTAPLKTGETLRKVAAETAKSDA